LFALLVRHLDITLRTTCSRPLAPPADFDTGRRKEPTTGLGYVQLICGTTH
jgi:hypothetical protein